MNALVSNKRLEKYGEFLFLDQLTKMYPAYKHSDIFELTVNEVYTIKMMLMENNHLERQRGTVRSQLAKSGAKGKRRS